MQSPSCCVILVAVVVVRIAIILRNSRGLLFNGGCSGLVVEIACLDFFCGVAAVDHAGGKGGVMLRLRDIALDIFGFGCQNRLAFLDVLHEKRDIGRNRFNAGVSVVFCGLFNACLRADNLVLRLREIGDADKSKDAEKGGEAQVFFHGIDSEDGGGGGRGAGWTRRMC